MSRARRQVRDWMKENGRPEARNDMQPKVYQFPVQTPQGPGTINVPAEEMRVCPCGCDLFRALHRVTWITPNAFPRPPAIQLVVNVYVCEKCGHELNEKDLTHREAKAGAKQSLQQLLVDGG